MQTKAVTGDDLRNIRERLGMSQADLAEKLGLSERTLQRREASGSRDVPRSEAVHVRLLWQLHGIEEAEQD